MVDFVTAISTATQAIGLVNQLRDAQKAYDAAEWKLKVAELCVLADVKNALIDAKEEARAKDDELDKLKRTLTIFHETVEVNGYLYDKDDEGAPTGHAYCPVYIAKDGYMFHLTLPTASSGRDEVCPNCKARYNAFSYY
jgi:hypothetical protein